MGDFVYKIFKGLIVLTVVVFTAFVIATLVGCASYQEPRQATQQLCMDTNGDGIGDTLAVYNGTTWVPTTSCEELQCQVHGSYAFCVDVDWEALGDE